MWSVRDGLYKTEVLSGEEIFTDKADADAVVHVDIDGKSYQNAGSGKNIAGRLYSAVSYGRDSTTTRMISSSTNKLIIERVKPNTTYTVSKDRAGTELRYFFYDEFPELGSDVVSIGGDYADIFISTTFRTTSDTKYVAISLGTKEEFSWVQLEEGSTATAYEPPAPSPDYPIEIHSLNDFDVVSQKSEGGAIDGIEVGGRNLLRNTSYEKTVTRNLSYNISKPLEVGAITYSVWLKANRDTTVRVYINDDSGQNRTGVTFASGVPVTTSYQKYTFTANLSKFSDTTDRIMMRVYGLSGDVITGKEAKLEKGNKATDWTPAPEDITENDNHPLIDKINLSLSEPLRSVGDVKDRLFRDSDGLWKVERKVGELNLSSTAGNTISNYSFYNTENYMSWRVEITQNLGNKYGKVESTHAPYVLRAWSRDSLGVAMSVTGNRTNIWLQLPKTFATTSNQVRASNISIIWELQSPTIETPNQELQDKLNNLRSFESSNYVYTVLNKTDILSENLKPTLHAKFLYNNWYKEDRVINNLMIYNRALTNEEMLQNYKTIKRRWGM